MRKVVPKADKSITDTTSLHTLLGDPQKTKLYNCSMSEKGQSLACSLFVSSVSVNPHEPKLADSVTSLS